MKPSFVSIFLRGIIAGFALISASVQAAVVWNELPGNNLSPISDPEDLSGNATSPTPLTFQLGVNSILGRMGRDDAADPIDRDIFTVTIQPGQSLTSIRVVDLDGSGGAGSFYAVGPGSTINLNDPSTHISNALINLSGEVLDDLIENPYNGGTGLSGPLGPGTYTFWFQETSAIIRYEMAYTVVPEPIANVAFAAALLGIGIALRARHSGHRPCGGGTSKQ